LPRYLIARSSIPVPLTGDASAPPWCNAETARIDQFPWHFSGRKQGTTCRVLYDSQSVYVQFQAEDRHISARVTELNGPVCTDSCVEFFATIDPARIPDYFNFETNCCGQVHLAFGPQREGRKLVPPAAAATIRIATALPGSTKEESPDDDGWWLAAAIPFRTLGELAGRPVRPERGTVWRGNFYRCGGRTDPQFACWSPVRTPKPDFHRPEFFGELLFG